MTNEYIVLQFMLDYHNSDTIRRLNMHNSRQLSLRVPEGLYNQINKIKNSDQRSISNTLNYLLTLGIDQHKKIKQLEKSDYE